MISALALLGLVQAVYAEEPFKPYLDCLKMVRLCSSGKSTSGTLDSSSEIALQYGAHAGKDGFYAYAPEDAYFHEFPPAPPPVVPYVRPAPSFFNLYGFLTMVLHPEPPKRDPHIYFKLEPGLHDILYLSFKREDAGGLTLDMLAKTPTSSKLDYRSGAGGECHADAESRALIVAETLGRIGTVFATYHSAPAPEKGDVAEEYNIVGHELRITFQKSDCVKGLEACMGSEDLKTAATVELKKFP